MELSSLNEVKFIVLKQKNDFDEITNFFTEQLLKQNRDIQAHEKSFNEMEELKDFKHSIQLRLTSKIQELQNEIDCMNDFQDAGVRSGHSHITSQLVSFPPHPDLGRMLSRSIGMPSHRDGPPDIGTRIVHRETFLQIQPRLPQYLIRSN